MINDMTEAKFICSACGADRGCDCNAPAVEKLAGIREQARQRDRAYKERKRQQKQQSGDVANGAADRAEFNEQHPEVTTEEHWQNSLGYMAGEAISLDAYWRREYGDWETFGMPSHLITLAEQAADAWAEIAARLRSSTRKAA